MGRVIRFLVRAPKIVFDLAFLAKRRRQRRGAGTTEEKGDKRRSLCGEDATCMAEEGYYLRNNENRVYLHVIAFQVVAWSCYTLEASPRD